MAAVQRQNQERHNILKPTADINRKLADGIMPTEADRAKMAHVFKELKQFMAAKKGQSLSATAPPTSVRPGAGIAPTAFRDFGPNPDGPSAPGMDAG